MTELFVDLAPAVEFGGLGRTFLVILIAGVPLLATLRPNRPDEIDLPPRLALYGSAITVIWILAGLTGVVLLAEETRLAEIGLHPAAPLTIGAWAAGTTALSLATAFVITRLGAWIGARESRLAFYLIPTNGKERSAFIGLSASAGFCEELVYHGYAIAGLTAWLESGWLAALVANLAFGALHGYQNAVGVVRAGVMGFVLSLPVISGAGLWPAMIAHFLVDAAAGLGAWRWIVPQPHPGSSRTPEEEGRR